MEPENPICLVVCLMCLLGNVRKKSRRGRLTAQSSGDDAEGDCVGGVAVRQTIPTVLVASRPLLREGLVSLLRGTPYEVVAAVVRPAELANHHFAKRRPLLAVVGVDWLNESLDQATEDIRQLRSMMPDSKVILVDETNGPVNLASVLALAPDGYILNLGSRELLLKALELIFMGQQIFVLGRSITPLANERGDIQPPEGGVESQSWGPTETTNHDDFQLSTRERQVLICLAHGESNKRIAWLCHISDATVKAHLRGILRKTNAHNRTQAAIWAIEHGLRGTTLKDNAKTPVRHVETMGSMSPSRPPQARSG